MKKKSIEFGAEKRSATAANERRRRSWMRKITISLAKQIQNSPVVKLRPRYEDHWIN